VFQKPTILAQKRNVLLLVHPPAAVSNSPTRVQVKIPHVTVGTA
jgi:hypothetical protein